MPPACTGGAAGLLRALRWRVAGIAAAVLMSLASCGGQTAAQESESLGAFFTRERAPATCDDAPALGDDLDTSLGQPPRASRPVLLHTEPLDELESPWFTLSDMETADREDMPQQSWLELPEPLWEEPRVSDEAPDAGDDKVRPTANITVQIQSDFAWFGQDADNIAAVGEIPDGAFFRRSRLGVFGELYETVEYRLELDFAGDARPRFLDNWIALTNIPIINNVIIGHYFEPFSLERYSPNRFITFTERSLADTFVPARNMGMMVYGNAFEERLTVAFGGFRSNSDDYGDDVSFAPGYAATAHSTFLAWFEEDDPYTRRLLHLGASTSHRTPGDDPVRYASRPSIRMRQQGVGGVPNFVDTGDILDAKYVSLYGLEAAWVHGPFSLQSEWTASYVDRSQHESPFFSSAYLFGTWFLTGESRSYSPTSILGRFREGIFQRVTPRSNVFDRTRGTGWTGIGAIELAARWAYIDLNDAGIQGGYLDEMTYGVNWYLNPYTKAMFNYVRPRLHDPVAGHSMADMFVVRYQFEF